MLIERASKGAVEGSQGDGVFSAVMATEGEASDGHIISIRGIETSPQVPMLFGHYSSEQIPLVGSLRKPTKSYRDVPTLRQQGHINLNGDGILSEFRRGLNQLVEDGDLNAVSIRIDVLKTTPRRNLAKDHHAFVDAAKVDREDPRMYGQFIERSAQKEGSLVAIGADPKALIGRADAASNEHVKFLFRALSESTESDGDGLGDLGDAFTALRQSLDDVRELGVDDGELADYLSGDTSRAYTTFSFTDDNGESQSVRIRRDVYDALIGESQSAYRGAVALLSEIERERFSKVKQVRKQVQTQPQPMDTSAIVEALREIPSAVASAASDALARQLGGVRR